MRACERDVLFLFAAEDGGPLSVCLAGAGRWQMAEMDDVPFEVWN